MNDKSGGPAFPAHQDAVPGMTVRDWFAGMALQGYVSQYGVTAEGPLLSAKRAYELADAMIAARGEKGEVKA